MQLTPLERIALADVPEDERAKMLAQYEKLICWYEDELARIKRRADRTSPAVRATLAWSIPQYEAVIRGKAEPVYPPPPPDRVSRMIDAVRAAA